MKKGIDDSGPEHEAEKDELLNIDGIQPRFVKALHRVGIHHLPDLIHYTPDTLKEAIREKTNLKTLPSRNQLKSWIMQAETEQTGISSESILSDNPSSDVTLLNNPTNEKRSLWRQLAGFSVFFDCKPDEHQEKIWQTRVYHDETGKEDTFDGINPAEWVGWILERAKLPVEFSVVAKPAADTLHDLPPTTPKVDIEFQGIDIRSAQEEPLRRLEVEARFKITSDAIDDLLHKKVSYHIEVYITRLENQESIQVAYARNCMKSKISGSRTLLDFPMPASGRYELNTYILLPSLGAVACHTGPVFTVKT